jgi:hypothetical protein
MELDRRATCVLYIFKDGNDSESEPRNVLLLFHLTFLPDYSGVTKYLRTGAVLVAKILSSTHIAKY